MLEENLSVLAIDFRGYNKSTQGNEPNALYKDILAGIKFLKNQPSINQITVLGASMGGAAAAKANINAAPNTMDQLILLSPAKISAPKKLSGQLLFITSQKEYLAKMITSAFEQANNPKKLLLINGAAHAQNIFNTSEKEVLTKGIINFLKQKNQ